MSRSRSGYSPTTATCPRPSRSSMVRTSSTFPRPGCDRAQVHVPAGLHRVLPEQEHPDRRRQDQEHAVLDRPSGEFGEHPLGTWISTATRRRTTSPAAGTTMTGSIRSRAGRRHGAQQHDGERRRRRDQGRPQRERPAASRPERGTSSSATPAIVTTAEAQRPSRRQRDVRGRTQHVRP